MPDHAASEKRDVPFVSMGGVYGQDDLDAAMKTVEATVGTPRGFFPLPEETDFQDALAEHEGAERAIVVNACGTALDCCMMALDIGKGDDVITTPLTFVCTAGAAVARGARVVFADIDPVTLNLAPDTVREAITDRTKAIVPVHYAGLACELDAFDQIHADTGIPIIYDAAHAVGARYRGQPIGGRGQASCYSFQSNKNMTCLGEGGAVTSNDAEFAERVRQLKTFGYIYGGPSIRVASIGFNYRMTKVQCAVGLTQLAKLGKVLEVRRERMGLMDELLAGVNEIIRPAGIGPDHGAHLYVIRLDTDTAPCLTPEFAAHLKETYGVGTAKHYPAVWTWEAFADLGYTGAGCPVAEKACRQVLSLPIFPHTTEDDCRYIAWAVKQTLTDLRT